MFENIKFKEFFNKSLVDKELNSWIDSNQVKIIDFKYCASDFGSHVLIAYKEE